jgi:hypothetical protein
LKAVKKKSYKGKLIKITANFLSEILKARRSYSEAFWALNEYTFNLRIIYPAKLSFKMVGAIKNFHDKQKLKRYMTTKPPLQKILKEYCTQNMKEYKTVKEQAVPNDRRRKDKKVESNINSAAHNPTLKQQKQLNDRNHHIPIYTNTEC